MPLDDKRKTGENPVLSRSCKGEPAFEVSLENPGRQKPGNDPKPESLLVIRFIVDLRKIGRWITTWPLALPFLAYGEICHVLAV